MKAIESLLIGLFVLATSSAISAEAAASLTIHADGHSFTTDVPRGWVVVNKAGSGSDNLAQRLFDLVPSDSNADGKIIIAYYPGKVPVTAQLHWGRRTPSENSELPRVEDLPEWTFFGVGSGRVRTAYYSTGDGTLVVDIAIKDDQVEKVLLPLLGSFKRLRARAIDSVTPN